MRRTSQRTSCQLKKLYGHSKTDNITAMAQVNYAVEENKKHTPEANQQEKTSSKPPKHPNKTDVKCKYSGGKHVRKEVSVPPLDKVAAYVTREIIFPHYFRVPVRMSINLKLMTVVIVNHATLSRQHMVNNGLQKPP